MIDMRPQIRLRMNVTGVTGAELAQRMDSSGPYFSRFMNALEMRSEAYQEKAIILLGGVVPEVETPVVKWTDNGSSDRVQRKGQGSRRKG